MPTGPALTLLEQELLAALKRLRNAWQEGVDFNSEAMIATDRAIARAEQAVQPRSAAK